MRTAKRLGSTVAVVRSFNNPHITARVNSLLAMGIGRVIVVVNGERDNGATPGFLSEINAGHRLQVIVMKTGYTWSNALNRALMAIQIANASGANFRFVFNDSVESCFKQDEMDIMMDTFADDPILGVVGTSFTGYQNGNIVPLGKSYKHPRNTGMIIRLEAFGQFMPMFNSFCDDIGGMEDIYFILWMLVTSNLRYEMLDLGVKLIIGANYHQPTKEANERQAMDKIIAQFRSLFPVGTTERERIEKAIADMGLEEA